MTAFNGLIVALMAVLFLVFGYLGVPVAFALIAGVVVGTLFTPVSLPSIITQLFNGIDTEALMAVPFFLLVGELMTSANVVVRIANLSHVSLTAILHDTRPANDLECGNVCQLGQKIVLNAVSKGSVFSVVAQVFKRQHGDSRCCSTLDHLAFPNIPTDNRSQGDQ